MNEAIDEALEVRNPSPGDLVSFKQEVELLRRICSNLPRGKISFVSDGLLHKRDWFRVEWPRIKVLHDEEGAIFVIVDGVSTAFMIRDGCEAAANFIRQHMNRFAQNDTQTNRIEVLEGEVRVLKEELRRLTESVQANWDYVLLQ